MDGLEERKAALEAQLADTSDVTTVALHPGIADVYARKVADLIDCLNDPSEQTEAGEIIRSLIDRIVVTPANKRNLITLHGALAGILSLCASGMDGRANARWKGGRSGQVTMVAGERIALWRKRPSLLRLSDRRWPGRDGRSTRPAPPEPIKRSTGRRQPCLAA